MRLEAYKPGGGIQLIAFQPSRKVGIEGTQNVVGKIARLPAAPFRLARGPLGNERLSGIHIFLAIDQAVPRRGCICDRPLRLVISTSPIAFKVRCRTVISAHHDAPFFRRCSADWALELERRIIPGHASLLPLFGER